MTILVTSIAYQQRQLLPRVARPRSPSPFRGTPKCRSDRPDEGIYLYDDDGRRHIDCSAGTFNGTLLLDISQANQRSCVAASTLKPHDALLNGIRW